MLDLEKNFDELSDEELWEVIEEMTSNMDEEEREELLEGWGEKW